MENIKQILYSMSGKILIELEDGTMRLYKAAEEQDFNDFIDATHMHMGMLYQGSGPFYVYKNKDKPLEQIFHEVWIKDHTELLNSLIRWVAKGTCDDTLIDAIKEMIVKTPEILLEYKPSVLRVAGLSEKDFYSFPLVERDYVPTYDVYQARIYKELKEIRDAFTGMPEIYAIYQDAMELVENSQQS